MSRGGARVNGGRKAGGTNARTRAIRAISDEALASGCHPLQVMLDNMRFFHNEAQGLLAQLIGVIKKGSLTVSHLELLGKLYNTRNEAQKCAVDAAPYVHARLSAIAVSGTIEHRKELPEGLLMKEALELYRRTAKARPPEQVVTLEHKPSAEEVA